MNELTRISSMLGYYEYSRVSLIIQVLMASLIVCSCQKKVVPTRSAVEAEPPINSAPTPGTFTRSTSITDTGFTLNWTFASDEQTSSSLLDYLLCSSSTSQTVIDTVSEYEQAKIEMAFTPSVQKKTVTGKTSNGKYYFNVVVRDSDNNKSIYDGFTQTLRASVSPTPSPSDDDDDADAGVSQVWTFLATSQSLSVERYEAIPNSDDRPIAIRYTGTLDIGCGSFTETASVPNFRIARVSSTSRTCLWAKKIASPNLHSMLYGKDDRVYLAGSYDTAFDFGDGLATPQLEDGYILKLNATNGVLI